VQISTHDLGGQTVRVGIRPGETEHPPLLLFNGIGANIELMQPFVDALEGHEAIVFDVPGVGGSPAPWLPYRPSTLAILSARLLDRLGYDQVDVLGVSWGGALAQQFAFAHPKLSAMLKMATPRRYKDPSYMRQFAGEIYGGALRHEPDRAGAHLRHVRWSSDYGYYLQMFACFGWSSLPWLPFLRQPTRRR
jgi:pimeloyl-ACP methyl ester carboxylesterase